MLRLQNAALGTVTELIDFKEAVMGNIRVRIGGFWWKLESLSQESKAKARSRSGEQLGGIRKAIYGLLIFGVLGKIRVGGMAGGQELGGVQLGGGGRTIGGMALV